nr:MAG TPA: BLOC-1-related complex sub-unit 8 [Caudoviricetes sp.]
MKDGLVSFPVFLFLFVSLALYRVEQHCWEHEE